MSLLDRYEVVIGRSEDKVNWNIDFKKGVCKVKTESGTHSFKYAEYKPEVDQEILINFAIKEFQGVNNLEDWIIDDVESLRSAF